MTEQTKRNKLGAVTIAELDDSDLSSCSDGEKEKEQQLLKTKAVANKLKFNDFGGKTKELTEYEKKQNELDAQRFSFQMERAGKNDLTTINNKIISHAKKAHDPFLSEGLVSRKE